MSKSVKKKLVAQSAIIVPTPTLQKQSVDKTDIKKPASASKQSCIIAMLHSPTGATIPAMMKTTGWQQHSVRGFLAGVVRKRLKLKLGSKKVDGNRIYKILGGANSRPKVGSSKRQSP